MITPKLSRLSGVLFGILFIMACQPNSQQQTTDTDQISQVSWTTDSETAKSDFLAALEEAELGAEQQARPLYTKAIEKDPEFAMAYLHRAFTSGSAQEFASDIKKANQYKEGLSDPEKRFLAIANTYLTRDSEKELELAKDLAATYPKMARAHGWLYYAYDDVDQVENARASLLEATKLDPDWAGALSAMGMSYIFDEPKNLDKAEEFLSQSLSLAPDNAMANINMGDVYRAKNNLNRALVYYNKAAKLNPKESIAHSKAGHVNSLLGNYEEARTNYRTARPLSTFPMASVNFEAFTYLYEGKPDKALKYLNEQAMKIDEMNIPKSRITSTKMSCMNSCSWIALHTGNTKHIKELNDMKAPLRVKIASDIGTEASEKTQKARELMWVGLASAMESDFADAYAKADAMRKALEGVKEPDKLEGFFFLTGYTKMKEGKYAEAVQNLEQSNYKNNMYMKYTLAMAAEKAGDSQRSVKLLNELADYNFNNVGYALVRKEVKEQLAKLPSPT